jgi:hydrogenase-4 component F
MLLAALIFIPVLGAIAAAAMSSNARRPWVMPIAASLHFAAVLMVLALNPAPIWGRWVGLDPPGKLVLLLISTLFLICSIYTAGYLRYRTERSNRVLIPCLLMFLSGATLVCVSQQLGLMWIAIETTALSTAPMIYFNRTPHSIEATWKYLLLSSVGIALALLGSFFLVYASLGHDPHPTLLFSHLVRQARSANADWLKMAFVLLLVGYGTKMGLAPMHTWKPDAYGEAPGVVGALLAGGLTSCAFLALLRVDRVCIAGGLRAYTSHLFIAMGLLSMAVAAVFMVGQKDIKRMLAYSSVEQMGILALGAGIGGPALYGALLQMINNGLTKGMLFLSAGNIHRSYGSKSTDDVRGAMRRLPLSGTVFMLGFLAITGSPPFGPFVSIFTILNTALSRHYFFICALFLLLLLMVFIGMGRTVLAVTLGKPPPRKRPIKAYRDGLLTGLPLILSFLLVLMLGVHIPPLLAHMLHQAQTFMEPRP